MEVLGRLTLTGLMFWTIVGCHRAPYNEAQVRNLTMGSISPMPTVPQPPTYLAADYGKRGQPALTPAEKALIRRTLAVIKPCQRPLLRYVFPDEPGADPHMALIFVEPGKPIFDAHVLWHRNLFYNEGNLGAAPGPNPPPADIRYDVARTPCASELK